MTRTELIVRTQDNLPEMTLEQVTACCNALLETICDALSAGHSVTLPKLGEFSIRQHRARVGRDPRNGQERAIPSCAVVQFSPHPSLKNSIRNRRNKG